MTHEEINEAIAEHLYRGKGDLEIFLTHPHRPDFCNDLNAMHEAEKVIRNSWDSYFESLISVRWRDAQPDRHPADLSPAGATAEQRAEAFLRTLNLWK